ncbi:MAG TPA: DNA-3-methyladenine glycosylase I [Candidatus Paceibacterota bacterium]|jgi:DNA-3-methyladenine glycosylase I|nr:DNA-3-methyladenine glycosylase I [Candidatus Paceibacterota bacterium]
MKIKPRCSWGNSPEIYTEYHDKEWGVPLHDDQRLFEMLNLEGAQAGLSWITVLKKRDNYRKAFDHFDAKKIVKYSDAKKEQLMKNEGIIRNRLKINAVIENAKAYMVVQKQWGSFDKYIWHFVGNKPMKHAQQKEAIKISEIMSKQLKKDGFRFVGATICFAFMQAVGMINDHPPTCFKYKK